jgi:DNA repair protein RadC
MSDEKPHYFGHRQRLRDRFEKAGLDGFAPHEVLELLLTLAVPRRDVKEPAKKLLAQFGSLRGVLDASLEDSLTP